MMLTADIPAGLDPVTWQDFLRVAGQPGFTRWQDQITRTGGCADPIHLTGSTTTLDPATGQVLYSYSTAEEPGGRLRVACGNRRASRCPACARTYAGDTYQLILSGLTGGKAYPPPSPTTPGSSPPSPPPASARSITAPPPGVAAAAQLTRMVPPNSVHRWTRSRTTTRGRCCGTTTPPTCGAT